MTGPTFYSSWCIQHSQHRRQLDLQEPPCKHLPSIVLLSSCVILCIVLYFVALLCRVLCCAYCCVVLFCVAVLSCVVLFCNVLCNVRCCMLLLCVVWYCYVMFCTVSRWFVMFCTVVFVLCCALLSDVVHIVSCCFVMSVLFPIGLQGCLAFLQQSRVPVRDTTRHHETTQDTA